MIKDIKWAVKTAGPSPFDNNRTELFLLGCKKAILGSPCKGCFNPSTWDNSKCEVSHNVNDIVENINKFKRNNYITIGGGEPTDQLIELIKLCKNLKKHNFHIMIYTWRSLQKALNNDFQNVPIDLIAYNNRLDLAIKDLLNYVDIVVDGEFVQELSLWDDTKKDGFFSSIGSANQIVWDINSKYGFAMKDIDSIELNFNNKLFFRCINDSKKIFLNMKGK